MADTMTTGTTGRAEPLTDQAKALASRAASRAEEALGTARLGATGGQPGCQEREARVRLSIGARGWQGGRGQGGPALFAHLLSAF